MRALKHYFSMPSISLLLKFSGTGVLWRIVVFWKTHGESDISAKRGQTKESPSQFNFSISLARRRDCQNNDKRKSARRRIKMENFRLFYASLETLLFYSFNFVFPMFSRTGVLRRTAFFINLNRN